MGLNEFREKMNDLGEAVEASGNLVSKDVNERRAAYARAHQYAQELGQVLDPTNPEDVNNYLFLGVQKRQDIASGYFGANLESLLSDEDARKGLVKRVLSVPPVEIGSQAHDNIVEAHKEFSALNRMARQYKDGEISHEQVASVLKDYVIASLNKKLSTDEDADNQYLSARFRENAQAIILNGLYASEESARRILGVVIGEAGDRFEAHLPDDEAKIAYTQENIRALASNGDQERAYAANIFNEITPAEKDSPEIAGRIGPERRDTKYTKSRKAA